MKRFLTVFALVLACASSSFASSMAVDFLYPGIVVGPSLSSRGFKFQANSAETVSRLGVFDAYQDGLSGIQQVGLWDSHGALLASTLVDNSDFLEGFWRFRAITSVTLTVGETYYVASQGGEAYTYQTTGFNVNPFITYLQDSWNHIGNSMYTPLGFPISTNNISASQGGGFFGANLDFASDQTAPASIPEPASLILLGSGLAGLLLRRRGDRE